MPARILVAEDQIDIRDLLVMNLRTAGHEVSAVGDGQQALARQLEAPASLLLLDLMMPGSTAWRFARRRAPKAAPRRSRC